jgi:hypothetical protein
MSKTLKPCTESSWSEPLNEQCQGGNIPHMHSVLFAILLKTMVIIQYLPFQHLARYNDGPSHCCG